MELQENKRQEDIRKEVYEVVETESVKEIEVRVKEQFGDKAWLYAVLDYAVGFGIYENGDFVIGLDNSEKPVPLEWKYLQELRIFNGTGELRLAPFRGIWVGRYRGCHALIEENVINSNDYWLDERQKIWGEVKNNHAGKTISHEYSIPYAHEGLACESTSESDMDYTHWNLLSSNRGTRIWIPVRISAREGAICVRKFMRIPTIDDKELVYQSDFRMVGFCPWSEVGGKEDGKIG